MHKFLPKQINYLIVNYESDLLVDDLIHKIFQSKICLEKQVLIYSNSKLDESLVSKWEKNERVIFYQGLKNIGFGAACNLLAASVRTGTLVILNPDLKLNNQNIKALERRISSQKSGSAIHGFKMLGSDGHDYLGNHSYSTDYYGYVDKGSRGAFYIEGSLMYMDIMVFEQLDGFDDQYFMYIEDVDFCWRAQLLGLEIQEDRELVIEHVGSARASRGRVVIPTWRKFHIEKNIIRTILKNVSLIRLPHLILIILSMQILEIIFLLTRWDWRTAAAILRAIEWNIRYLPDTLKKRREIQRKRTRKESEIKKLQTGLVPSKLKRLIQYGIPFYKL